MAPRNYPDEIDVFTVPHSRMKELVNIYTQKFQCLDFRDGREVVSLLRDLDYTLYEFKSHESIENIFIMDQLKNRLKQRQIYNSAVCDCHNDNRLADVLQLVRTGTKVRDQGIIERLTFCQELQRAFEEFVENFLTHMEEEEQVFQPLLVEYFEYDELKILKDIVLKEHEHVKERHSSEKAHEEEPETCDVVKDLRDLDWDLCCLSEETLEEESCSHSLVSHTLDGVAIPSECNEHPLQTAALECTDLLLWENTEAPNLPTEILLEIFQYLSPQDLGRCAQVCSSWNYAAYTPSLWKAVYPVQWARGIWEWYDVGLCNALEDEAQSKQTNNFHRIDEDKDIDEAEVERNPLAAKEHMMLEELVTWVLPRIGYGVKELVVDAGSGITSRPLHHALILCPNITSLSAAYTQIDFYLFKGLWLQGALRKLERLDLRGCELIDDDALECFARCASPDNPYLSNDSKNSQNDVQISFCQDVIDDFPLDEPMSVSDESVYQYCDYCTCWQANLVIQKPNKSYLNNSCQSRYSHSTQRQKQEVLPSYKGSNVRHYTNHPKQKCHRGVEFQVLPLPSVNALSSNSERDIEEICCHSGSFNLSEDSSLQTNAPRKPIIGSGNHTSLKQQKGHLESVSPFSMGYFQLTHLNLSGCWRITDEGLLAMVDAGVVDSIYHLDVSGCFQLTGEGLKAFVSYSRALKAQNLFYCDNIVDGPYPSQANGCSNLCNPVRVCCRNGR